MNDIIKIGNVELTRENAERLYTERKFIVTYSKIYQLNYSNAQHKVYGTVIFNQKGLTRKGRFYAMDAKTVNNLLGYELVV